jgi:hypothetical protein
MPAPLRFVCNFDNRYTCTLTFDVDAHRRGETKTRDVEWSKMPPQRIIPKYLEWVHTVNEKIADALGAPILHVIQTGPGREGWEFWEYYPGGKRQRVEDPSKP